MQPNKSNPENQTVKISAGDETPAGKEISEGEEISTGKETSNGEKISAGEESSTWKEISTGGEISAGEKTSTGEVISVSDQISWRRACRVEEAAPNGGVCIRFDQEQVAIFHFARRNEWYATQNECPHKKQMALSRGMIGTHLDDPKIACPFHKKTFSLRTGQCLNGDECSIRTYPVKVEDGDVFVQI